MFEKKWKLRVYNPYRSSFDSCGRTYRTEFFARMNCRAMNKLAERKGNPFGFIYHVEPIE